MSNIVIRAAVAEDSKYIAEIEKKYIPEAWSEKLISEEIEKNESIFYIAFVNDEICGYVSGDNIAGELFINNIAVDENHRREGIASCLFEILINEAKVQNCFSVTLEVRSKNINAIALYEKYGFKNAGVRKNYYSSPADDAIIYTKELK